MTRDGKTFKQTVYVKPSGEETEIPVGGEVTPEVKGMNIERYSEKALIIRGDTYVNIDKLREIKKEMAEKFNLKISHSGERMMHAMKAIGVFFPYYNAIGVSFTDNLQGKLTLSHEFAHFMDYWKGKQEKRNYTSDQQGSAANQIAKIFRRNMNKVQTSNYQNRTCECFARAFQQYFDNKVNGNKAEMHIRDNQVDNKKFNSEIKPLIENWLAENEKFLKSLNLNFEILGVN